VDIPATSDNIPGTLVLRDTSGGFLTSILEIIGSLKRIRADFSSTPLSSRVYFETSVPNAAASLAIIPNGTSTYTNFAALSNADADNSALGLFVNDGSKVSIEAVRTGTGSFLHVVISTNNAERVRIDTVGNVGIGATANAAALLDVASTTKGFLPPRMTTTQRDAISTPPAGLIIYNTTTNKLNVRTASSWEAVTSA
jgi:hypothetical protein